MRVRRSHRDQKTPTCTGHAAGLLWSIHSGLSDFDMLLKCPRRSESPKSENGSSRRLPQFASDRIKTSPCMLWCELRGPTRTNRLPRARGLLWSIHSGLSDFDMLLKCSRRSESPKSEKESSRRLPQFASDTIKTSPCRLWCELRGPTRTNRLPRVRGIQLAYFWPVSLNFRILACC